jgi:UDPglucose--hexose-1-phosphate uridylyltransferase
LFFPRRSTSSSLSSNALTDLRTDPLTGRRVAIAPARAKRPGAAKSELEPPTPEELEQCPFCAGREDRTPPETLRIGDPWRVRVVPNLYPAFERQEVVVHTPRHARTLAELSGDELAAIAEAWARRREAISSGYLHAFVNEGREAGSSLPHTHSQLVWLPEPPPETQHRVDRERWKVVLERGGLVLACPDASRLPYELVLAPAEPRANPFADELLPTALQLLGDAVGRVHRAAGAAPLNAWLHDSNDWHLELLPRLSILAGVELGGGWWINALSPEDAAQAVRD